MPDVIVGCKLPHGIVISPKGKKITLNGSNASRIFGGYGLTTVDKELMDSWMGEHKEFQPVKAGLIFVQSSDDRAKDTAKERASIKTGLEPLDPDAPSPGIKPEGEVKRTRKNKGE